MKFLVQNINPDTREGAVNSRVIEADSYSYDAASGRHLFHDKDSNLLANLVNVNVEPVQQ